MSTRNPKYPGHSESRITLLLEGLSLFPPRTGVGRSILRLIRQLRVHPGVGGIYLLLGVFPLGRHWSRSLAQIERLDLGVSVHRIPVPYGTLLRSWRYLDRPKVDRLIPGITVVHGPAHVLPSRSTAAGVLTIHDTSILDHPEWYSAGARGIRPQILVGLVRADRVIVPSRSVLEGLVERFGAPPYKMEVIPHDIEPGFGPVAVEERAALRESLFGFDFPYILWSGEISPRKNLPALFSTLLSLRKSGFSDIRLVIAGTRGYKSSKIMSEAEQMGLRIATLTRDARGGMADVILAGYLPDETLQKLYAAAELFLFPSWDEGFGFPVLEAMASGVPVVCSSTGSLPEICGSAAFMADPHEGREAFVQPVRILLTEPETYRSLRERGLRRARTFQCLSMAERTIQVYREALGSRNE